MSLSEHERDESSELVPGRVLAHADVAHQSKRSSAWSPVRLEVGDVIGDLTVVGEHERLENGQRVLLFRCECGRSFARVSSPIVKKLRTGGVPACPECTLRLRLLDHELHASDRSYYYRKLWYDTGSLYSRSHDERICQEIMEDLEQEIAPRRDLQAEEALTRGLWGDPTRNERFTQSAKSRLESARAEQDFMRDLRKEHAQCLETHENLAPYARVKLPAPKPPERQHLTRIPPAPYAPFRGPCPCESGKPFRECHGELFARLDGEV